ncbi:unnamed protein product [Closterium sp. NIES-53]
MGSHRFCSDLDRGTLTDTAAPLGSLASIHLQHTLLLLSRCISRRIGYLVRTTLVDVLPLSEWHAWYAELLNTALTAASIQPPRREAEFNFLICQATLPVALGGLGLTDPTTEAAPAYLASTTEVLRLLRSLDLPATAALGSNNNALQPSAAHSVTIQDMEGRLLPLALQHLHGEQETPSQDQLQRPLSQEVHAAKADALTEELRAIRSAPKMWHTLRLVSLRGEGAGAWLQALPLTPNLCFSTRQFRTALAFRMGIRQNVPTVCEFGELVADCSLPNYLLRFSTGPDKTRTHNQRAFAVAKMTREAQLVVYLENAMYSPPDDPKKADVILALLFLTGLVTTCSPPLCLWGCEAEIYAGAMAAQELRWLTYQLTDLGEQPHSPPVLYVDYKAMIALCQDQRMEHRTKHIALRYFLARELQQRGQLRLAYVAIRANTADVFTKALGSSDHQRFCTALGLVPTLPHLLPARTAATHRLIVEQDADDEDDDDPEQGLDTDDDEEEPEDVGMSPSDGDDEDEDAEDDAEEEAQPVSQPPKWSAARASGTNKGKGKAAPPPPRQEPRKKRSAAPVERGLWSDKESTIFAAAKWFMKEELESLKGKQGTQYWVRLLAHIKESNPGWCRGVNALQKQWRNLTIFWQEYKHGDGGSGHGSVEKPPWYLYLKVHNQDTAAAALHAVDGGGATDVNVPAGMEVPSSSQPGTSTPTFMAPPPPTTATPRRARVHETATMQAAMLVSATIKDCHGDAMTRIESLIREWMAQDMRLARERMTESAPPDVHRAPPDFSPPPPRGESAPPPEATQHGDDVGDVNTVTLGAEDVEIWVCGADD